MARDQIDMTTGAKSRDEFVWRGWEAGVSCLPKSGSAPNTKKPVQRFPSHQSRRLRTARAAIVALLEGMKLFLGWDSWSGATSSGCITSRRRRFRCEPGGHFELAGAGRFETGHQTQSDADGAPGAGAAIATHPPATPPAVHRFLGLVMTPHGSSAAEFR